MLREGSAWSDMRPHGVVGIITPYVFPLVIPVLHILAALVTGNTVVFKPSKFAPGVGQAIAERVDRCRLPRGAFNMVQGSGAAVGHRVATHPGIDALLFAGSHTTATAIRRATGGLRSGGQRLRHHRAAPQQHGAGVRGPRGVRRPGRSVGDAQPRAGHRLRLR
jgi:acyl-CoA reductase-like NAD-dependent aldehyde dehydrogenase